MFVIFSLLLMIAAGCCLNDQNFEIKSVDVKQDVTFTCPRTSDHKETLFWIRIISGHQPEYLGGTYGFDYNEFNETPHFTTKQGPGTFILHINQTEMIDTGLYYCIRTEDLDMTLLRGVFLKVKGPQSAISGISQAPPSESVHPGESVSLQCSVLSDSEKKTCPEHYRVFWFRAGSDQSHLSFIYTDEDDAECGNASQKCFYNFSKKVNVSDAATYYCAVAACGELMFGNGAKLDIKEDNKWDLKSANAALYGVAAAFVATVIVWICLIWTNDKNDCNRVKTVVIFTCLAKTEGKTWYTSQQ